jgi:hypothetical protein
MTLIIKVVCWTEPEDEGIIYCDIYDNAEGMGHIMLETDSFEMFKSILIEGSRRYQDNEVRVEFYMDDVKHTYTEGV